MTAKDETGDMIVVGKRGETAGLALEHLGSNLERIVRASHKPVFIANRAFKQIEKVLVAFDGATSSLKAVDFIARSPLFVGLKVALVFAGKATPEMTKALDSAVSTLKAGALKPKRSFKAASPKKFCRN